MKYFLILMLSFGFVGFSIIEEDVYGLVIPLSPDDCTKVLPVTEIGKK